jgi:hypothetical protein
LNLFRDIFPAARCVLLICFLSTTNTPQLAAGIFYFVEGFWRDTPLAPVIRGAEPEKLALLRPRHRTFRLVDLQPQLLGQEPAYRGHDPFSGADAMDVEVAVIRVSAEAVTPAGQLLVEIVEHDVA